MKKILIITYDMIPYAKTWGGAQRIYYLSKTLKERNFDVEIFALNKDVYNTYGKEIIVKTMFANDGVIENNTNDLIKNKALKIKQIIKKIDRCLFNEIQPGKGFISYRKFLNSKTFFINNVYKKEYDAVIISCPPFVLLNYIKIIKNKHNKQPRIILDYRDPWNFWDLKNRILLKKEKKFHMMSDAIVCTNSNLCLDMSRLFKLNQKKYYCIGNGYSGEICNSINSKNDKFTIVYSGTITLPFGNNYRNAINILRAYNELIEDGYKIKLLFVGADVNDKINDEGILKHTIIYGKVNENIANDYISKSDACLLIHTANDNSKKYIISGKIYDYIKNKKYIISISDNSSLHSNIINEYKIGINVENRVEDIKRALINAYDLWLRGEIYKNYEELDINKFSRECENEKYVKLLMELLNCN